MKRGLYSLGALIAAIVFFFGVNVLSDATLTRARLDLTQSGLYTLSPGTRSILANIKDPITLRLFYSERLTNEVPQLKVYADRVRDLLLEYAALSKGKIKLEIIDPEPYSDAEDRAVQAGVRAVPMDATGRNFYFGLVGTNLVDDRQTIAFFSQERERFLEYDLSKLVWSLNSPKKTKVAVVSGFPLEFGPGGIMAAMRGQSQPFAILTQLRQEYDVQVLNAEATEIPADIDVLVLAYVKDAKPRLLYSIDQYLMKGGRIVAFLDPYSEVASTLPDPRTGQQQMPGGDFSALMPTLQTALGIKIDPGKFVGDLNLAQRVNWGGAPGGQRQVVDYVAWLKLGQAQENSNDVITGQLNDINLASAGSLTKADGSAATLLPLLWSTKRSQLIDTDKLQGQPDPASLVRDFKSSDQSYVLAARVSGPVKTAFPDGPPPEEKKEGEAADASKPATPPAPQLKEGAKPADVIVVTDADMLDDRFWVRTQDFLGQRMAVPFASNADFLANAVENLAGSAELISLRGRGGSQRPFEAIEEMRREAGRQFLAQEQQLKQKLEATEKRIAELQGTGKKSGALSNAETEKAIEGFRADMVQTRKQLRAVQRELNRDITTLETTVTFVNIGLMPVLVAFAALGVAATRRRWRRHTRGKE